ncbi:DUF3146 family protein [Candidatus Cyanaurora vandensis]|uniref:DUF3146 family protein n=1 Tax=Candidatus Cyanaurora vandensis TaxID=2714958 RepID=UPI00257BBA4C|nr:DUF3146 family protein [Candidatus Cyanaurora vandensis]
MTMTQSHTAVQLRITHLVLGEGLMAGELTAGTFQWTFQWHFRRVALHLHPTRGRALVAEPLQRFLEQQDYSLEVGEVYTFTLRTQL